ncbi:hypothetical protein B0I37DRAFT_440312 [Chaetomium sp. MPI-CAGE-AT-0009]|nr:hypothetical protein B0I37DRAFT_440312 [Chaetomium sp. MPI-CAGE-AT-0009]
MQITRVIVTLAFVVSTGSALPWGNAPGLNAGNLDTARDMHEKRSFDNSMYQYVKVGLSSNNLHGSSSTGQSLGQETMEENQSSGASQTMSIDHDMNSDLAGGKTGASNKQLEGIIHTTNAPESQLNRQGSMVSCSNKMPSVQQNALEIQHNGAGKGLGSSENKINFAVRARGLFGALGESWGWTPTGSEQRELQQERSEQTAGARQDRGQVFMSTSKADMDAQRQQAAASVSQIEKLREERNHEDFNQKPDNTPADVRVQQHGAMHQTHNHAQSHTDDGSGVHAGETDQMNSLQYLDREKHQGQQELKQMNIREVGSMQQQQQMQQQMEQHMQTQSDVAECLHSTTGDSQSSSINEQDSEQSHA